MPIQRLHGDGLCAATDGLILTIRWSPTRIGGQHRTFGRRWPEGFAEIEEQIRYPVLLGRTLVTRPDLDRPFKAVYVASRCPPTSRRRESSPAPCQRP